MGNYSSFVKEFNNVFVQSPRLNNNKRKKNDVTIIDDNLFSTVHFFSLLVGSKNSKFN